MGWVKIAVATDYSAAFSVSLSKINKHFDALHWHLSCKRGGSGKRRKNMTLPVNASAQALAHANSHASTQKNSPAQAAREYLLTNPDGEISSFGKLVSQFAKEEPPA